MRVLHHPLIMLSCTPAMCYGLRSTAVSSAPTKSAAFGGNSVSLFESAGAQDEVLERLAKIAANSSSECDLCQTRWLFVLSSSGRTGSTTVMDMVNAVDGFYIAGENGGAIRHLSELLHTVQSVNTYPTHMNHAYQHREISEKGMLCAIQSLTREFIGAGALPASYTIGFKEVQINSESMLGFMKKAFPCAKFIVNTRRNIRQQLSSGRLAFRETLGAIEEKTRTLERWQSEHSADAQLLHLEDFSPDVFNKLLRWLGVYGCSFTSVSHANAHGSIRADANPVGMTGHCERK
eukprot:CAMPEP_0171187150 /NCGR_PEP_ID=MMETSP0790-20130122/17173_1 /TAXON_ID=2925 /ORGANISM="Alexandrium catenella, Strain OF101" /LENGTH=291 /DNA_ID=CAMNT_0011652203 /DNA_START=61 /DNA_END=936 /DNA_ORIENTATION=+